MLANVRRYVALAQSRGGACFCTRGAMQGYDVNLFILALAKTVTPGASPRREPGQPVPPLTVFHFVQKILAAQKPMTYTDLLCAGFIYSLLSSCSLGWHFVMLLWAVFNHALNHGKICIRILTNLLAHVRCYILRIFYGGLQLHESRNKHTSNCLALIQHISFSSKHPISGIHFCNNLAVVSYFSRIPSVLPMLILW